MLRNWPEVENNLWLARTWSSFFFLVLIISFRASCLPAGQQSAAQAFHTCEFRFEKQKMLLVVNARVTDPRGKLKLNVTTPIFVRPHNLLWFLISSCSVVRLRLV
ncbi:hypothetical protein OUZ56_022523 [Daphnia magna]|uniref:Secreted protein n=1 Tax=Daphnia magna TaxID=35525 RepID=A0ABR0AWN6_9CRUS|nr:hypothetical protein OUZ56_022523 [Daphnia magna]